MTPNLILKNELVFFILIQATEGHFEVLTKFCVAIVVHYLIVKKAVLQEAHGILLSCAKQRSIYVPQQSVLESNSKTGRVSSLLRAIRNTSPRRRLKRNSLAWPRVNKGWILLVQVPPHPHPRSLLSFPRPAWTVGFKAGSIS